jgi:hypothetical protein
MQLREVQEQPVDRITRAVTREVRTFSGEREQTDDISVLALRWMGHEAAVQPTERLGTTAVHG